MSRTSGFAVDTPDGFKSERLLSLDLFRGLAVAGMVLVVIRPSGTMTVGVPHAVPSACASEGPSIRAVTKTAPAAFLSISFSLAGQRVIRSPGDLSQLIRGPVGTCQGRPSIGGPRHTAARKAG